MVKPKDDPELEMGAGEEPEDSPVIGEGEEPEGDGDGEGRTQDDDESTLRGLMQKHGIKSVKELAERFESKDRKITELSRDRRVGDLTPPPYIPPARNPIPAKRREIEPPADFADILVDSAKAKKFLSDFRDAIVADTREEISQEEFNRAYESAAVEVAELQREYPEEFARLRPTMAKLANDFPRANARQLFSMASKVREEQAKNLRKEIFGDLDPDQIKTLLKKSAPAPISGAGGGGASSVSMTDRQKAESDIRSRILGATKLEA